MDWPAWYGRIVSSSTCVEYRSPFRVLGPDRLPAGHVLYFLTDPRLDLRVAEQVEGERQRGPRRLVAGQKPQPVRPDLETDVIAAMVEHGLLEGTEQVSTKVARAPNSIDPRTTATG